MTHLEQFYIDGEWVDPVSTQRIEVINPATEAVYARVAGGNADDIGLAVAAARRAFASYSRTTREQRLALLDAIIASYQQRQEDIAQAISQEMGAPITLSRNVQYLLGLLIFQGVRRNLETFQFSHATEKTTVLKEPIGVAGLITPWNWPMNQIALKVAPALAVGTTIVLKPSEITPVSAVIFAEILDDAGVPAGVFNLVNGDGRNAGAPLTEHPDVDMISFTGSTRAGIEIARAAAGTIKRVGQELGGKSANIIFEDADVLEQVRSGTRNVFTNSGQTCGAATRILVPRHMAEAAYEVAAAVATSVRVGDSASAETEIGPVANAKQYGHVQRLIEAGIQSGARLVAGGPGKPEGTNAGYFVRPTVFGEVDPDSAIAQEEIFGPVVSIIPFSTEEEAVSIANNSQYGLVTRIQTKDMDRARRLVPQLRSGQVLVNNPGWDVDAPFGGYKRSGNGREGGVAGFEEYLETKALQGIPSA